MTTHSILRPDEGLVAENVRLEAEVASLNAYAEARTARIGQLERLAAGQQTSLARHAEQRRAAAEHTAQVVRERDAARAEAERLSAELSTAHECRADQCLDAEAKTAEVERLRGMLDAARAELYQERNLRGGDVVDRLAAQAEVERLRATRFDPGPIVQPAALVGYGWIVRCLACDAGTLLGFPDRDTAVARAERHVHVYPDQDGYLDASGAWPS